MWGLAPLSLMQSLCQVWSRWDLGTGGCNGPHRADLAVLRAARHPYTPSTED